MTRKKKFNKTFPVLELLREKCDMKAKKKLKVFLFEKKKICEFDGSACGAFENK